MRGLGGTSGSYGEGESPPGRGLSGGPEEARTAVDTKVSNG